MNPKKLLEKYKKRALDKPLKNLENYLDRLTHNPQEMSKEEFKKMVSELERLNIQYKIRYLKNGLIDLYLPSKQESTIGKYLLKKMGER
nr:MAG: hypothetical protein [uncultured archaeon]